MTKEELGQWLRQEREKRGWSRLDMARQLARAARERDEKQVPDIDYLKQYVYRWENGKGLTHLYVTLYCHVLGMEYTEFPRQDQARPRRKKGTALVGRQGPHVPDNGHVTYRGSKASLGDSTVEHEVMMTAHESSDHAAERELQGIGEITLEQLHADLVRLSRLTDSGSPLPTFLDARRVRDRIYHLLDRRLWPREQADLYFLLGCINGLMGVNARRLGYPDAAEELIRAGWAYANAIDHNPLRGLLRAKLSNLMYWRGRFREAHDLAADGLRYASQGPLGAALQVDYARSAARLGNHDVARRAVSLAHDAHEGSYQDDLVEIGGEEFALSQPTTWAMAGSALAETLGAEGEAATELERAISLYDQGGPDQRHWFGGKALAGTDLAVVRLRSGELDGAATALESVLVLPPEQRVSSLTARLERVRDELAAPAFQGSPQARDLRDQIEEFSHEAVTVGLHSLSG
jgi:transcriptional regulator with XRE-family HTH domain